MNTQEIVAQLNEEIARLTKARDALMPHPEVSVCDDTPFEKLVLILKKGPARRGDLCRQLRLSDSALNTLIVQGNIGTYGRGWVKLKDPLEKEPQ